MYLPEEVREFGLLPLIYVLIFGLKEKSFIQCRDFNADKQTFEAQ